MEIERKWLLKSVPENLSDCPHHIIEQGYLNTAPVVRIRRQDAQYILTYKGSGLMAREEYNLPLTKEAYEHLKTKIDGRLISKVRYLIPLPDGLTIELDHFSSPHEGLYLAEIEFPSVEAAESYAAPDWFGEDVTYDPAYHNSVMSRL
ncbi:MAG: CYTH domain-containing protein [Lachnospiraceae bacterium]|nr:CYTH domain-containing protein [Lachnospiraceae bacterium]